MFITIYECRAKAGRVPEVLALFDDWQRYLSNSKNVVPSELLRSQDDTAGFIAVARFPNEDTAWAIMQEPNYREWYANLVSLCETGPTIAQYHSIEAADQHAAIMDTSLA